MLGKIAAILIFVQLIVSLLYSTYSLKLNKQFTDNLQHLDQLKLDIQTKESRLADLESIDNLKNSSDSAKLTPITKKLHE